MSLIKARDTGPELILRRHLSARGLRYRLYKAGVTGKPDIVFIGIKVAVFCDGDFWHGRDWKKRKARGQFKVRRKFWVAKIEANMRRDRRVNRKLRRDGWIVLRYWATEIECDGGAVTAEVARIVKRRRRRARIRRRSG